MSKTQERLEDASKAVTTACRSLVKQVQAIIDARANGEELVDYSKLSKHEFNRSYVFLIPSQTNHMADIPFTDTWRSKSRFCSSRMHSAEHEKIWARCASSLTRRTRNEWFRKSLFFCLACDTKLRSLLLYCNYIYFACSNFPCMMNVLWIVMVLAVLFEVRRVKMLLSVCRYLSHSAVEMQGVFHYVLDSIESL